MCLGDVRSVIGAYSFFKAGGEFLGVLGVFRIRRKHPATKQTYKVRPCVSTVHNVLSCISIPFQNEINDWILYLNACALWMYESIKLFFFIRSTGCSRSSMLYFSWLCPLRPSCTSLEHTWSPSSSCFWVSLCTTCLEVAGGKADISPRLIVGVCVHTSKTDIIHVTYPTTQWHITRINWANHSVIPWKWNLVSITYKKWQHCQKYNIRIKLYVSVVWGVLTVSEWHEPQNV